MNKREEIMELIKEIWEENPRWRFGQLISNILGEIVHNTKIRDIFFPEDDFWEKQLKEYKKTHSIYNYGQNLFKEGKDNE